MIEVTQLGKTYPGGVEAVKAVDFDVRAGEVFGLLGPNGAGKSTTIGMLTTTIEPTSGTARLAGFDVAKQPREARRVSSVVFQEPVVDRAFSLLAAFDAQAKGYPPSCELCPSPRRCSGGPTRSARSSGAGCRGRA